MSNLRGPRRAEYVRAMFARIAERYDLLNRLMTLGQDVRWRRETVARLEPPPKSWSLDLGTGTGDLALEIARQHPQSRIVAADFTLEMVQIGRSRDPEGKIHWVLADALALPFERDSFGAVVSGFLMRNVADVEQALSEQHRILVRPESVSGPGRIVILETTPPRGIMRPMIAIHLRIIIPLLGALVAGDREAYRYLPTTTEEFLSADELASLMQWVGFHAVSYVRRMFGSVAIHSGLAGSGSRDE